MESTALPRHVCRNQSQSQTQSNRQRQEKECKYMHALREGGEQGAVDVLIGGVLLTSIAPSAYGCGMVLR